MNESNLIRNEDLTPERLREITSKGGKASAEKRRKQKSMREMAKMFSELPVDDNAKQKLEKLGIPADQANYQMAMIVTLAQHAIKGDVKAIKAYQELLGQDSMTFNKKAEKSFKKAELRLKERELEIREKELEMKMKSLNGEVEEENRVIIVNDVSDYERNQD